MLFFLSLALHSIHLNSRGKYAGVFSIAVQVFCNLFCSLFGEILIMCLKHSGPLFYFPQISNRCTGAEVAVQMFSCEFCEIFKNIYFVDIYERLLLETSLDHARGLQHYIRDPGTNFVNFSRNL